ALAGYAFARMTFRGKNVLFALVLSILMVPYQIYLIPQYEIVQQLGWLNTVAGIAAPGIFSAFGTFLMRQHFMGMPRSLEEAARLDGANPWQTFWRIMFPLSGPALSAVAILTALASWNDLMWPLIVATYDDRTTLAVGLSRLQGQFTTDYPVMMAASFMARMLWARVNAASPRIRIAKARCSGSAGTRVARRAARNAAPTVAMAKVAVRPQSSCAVPQCETRPAAALTTVTASEVPTARLKG